MLRMVGNVLLIGCLGLFAPSAVAAVIIVNATDDLNDGTCNTAHCSLREAITAANAGAFTDTIGFDIELPVRGDLVIRPSGSALPTITAPVTIDGYTQTGTEGNTAALPFRTPTSGFVLTAVARIPRTWAWRSARTMW